MTVGPVEPALRSLAIVATRGTSNSLFQVATLVRAATALGTTVDVLFCDAALAKLGQDRIDVPEWSDIYSTVAAHVTERLRAADFDSMESFLRDAKEHGDDVHFWACPDSLDSGAANLGGLTPLLDGRRSLAEFERIAGDADARLSF